MDQVAAESIAERAPTPVRARTRRVWLVVPLLASVAVLIIASGRIDAPFNPSYDGFNTAVWATGARAVQADGWWEARAGSRADRAGYPISYAHHPPLTQVEASLAGSVFGDRRWVYRLGALVSSIAAVWACWGWLGACRFSPGARSLGLLVVAGTPLVLGFGLMLNMEIVWMPFAFGLLWAWRTAADDGPIADRAAVACGVLALAGSMAAHQGILLAAGLGVFGLLSARRAGGRPPRHVVATLTGAGLGIAVFVAWVWWASGGLSDLWRSAAVRSATNSGWASWLVGQAQLGVVLFGLVAFAALVGGLVLIRSRPELIGEEVVIVAVTALYAVAFRGGSTHPYWNAALLPAVALGGALVGERLGRIGPRVLAVGVVVAGVVALNCVATFRRPVDAGYGLIVAKAGRTTDRLSTTFTPADWMSYESGGPVRRVRDCAAVSDLAITRPDDLVLTSERWVTDRRGPAAWSGLISVAYARDGAAIVARAGDLRDAAC